MGNDRPIIGSFTDLVVGNRTFHYETDMEALEMAESLPDFVRWQVKLKNDKGTITSEKYKQKSENER